MQRLTQKQFKKQLNMELNKKKKDLQKKKAKIKEEELKKELFIHLRISVIEATKSFEFKCFGEIEYILIPVKGKSPYSIGISIGLKDNGCITKNVYRTDLLLDNTTSLTFLKNDVLIKVCEESDQFSLKKDIIDPFLEDLNPIKFSSNEEE